MIPSQRTTPSLIAVAVFAALLVLCFGMRRMMVFCTGPHSEGRVEFAHAGDCCCGHDHEAGGETPEPESVRGDGHGHCVDLALGLEIGPLPERVVVDHDPPLLHAQPKAVPSQSEAIALAVRPPTTGPPRPDPFAALRRTTLLQL